jgi:hypothetical protein
MFGGLTFLIAEAQLQKRPPNWGRVAGRAPRRLASSRPALTLCLELAFA